jgi:hypothetical protein
MVGSFSKAVKLLSVLRRSPSEFVDRTALIIGGRFQALNSKRWEYKASSVETVARSLDEKFGVEFSAALCENDLIRAETTLRERNQALGATAPFSTFHNGDLNLARFCYAAVRVLSPDLVVETGVCYGVTSLFILTAMGSNRKGQLISVDLPPLGGGGGSHVGWMVPDGDLRSRWQLRRGIACKILPGLLEELGQINIFVHDSLHTYANMRREFNLAWPRIAKGGMLISDDVEGNAAFHELVAARDVAFQATVQEWQKESMFGVARKDSL